MMTTPDLDHSNRLKIMLVDFDWDQIEIFTAMLDRYPESATLYIYGHTESDHPWCMTAARQSDAVLVNCNLISSLEMIKGYLLGLRNVSAYSANEQSFTAANTYHDVGLWFADVIKYYTSQSRGNNGI